MSSSSSALSLLSSHIRRRVTIADAECELLGRFFVPRKLRKRQFMVQEGEVCRYLAYVTDGCLREYTLDHRGEEHVLQFAVRDWWISDLQSYLSRQPARRNVDALQDSEVLLLEYDAREEMFSAIPVMDRFFRLLFEASSVATHKRISDALSLSAEEQYLSFLKTYPTIAEQIPQAQIASYLGITPQSLSRIRKEMTEARKQ